MPVISDAPWSAAFIGWVMKQAIARTTGLSFPENQTLHTGYAQLIRNPITGTRTASSNSPQRAYPFDVLNPYQQNGQQIELLKGDIVVVNRANSRLSYSSFPWTGASHGDIVVNDILFSRDGEVVGGNVSDKVSKKRVRTLRDAFVVLRPKAAAHRSIIAEVALDEWRLWNRNKWTENSPGGRNRVAEYWSAIGVNAIPSENVTPAPQSTRTSPKNSVTPFIESLESFHPKIQYELTRRRVSAETANTYMPFVKLTSLTRILPDNVENARDGAYCPSLGIHGQPEAVFDNIYYPKDNRSIVAYAVADDGASSIPVVVKDASADQANIPMPGITSLNIERGTAGPMGVRGGLARANVKIVAYSVGQLDALLRYFMRPATRVVLEVGRKSSNRNETIRPFDWKKSEGFIKSYFNDLIVNPDKQKEFIDEYIYGNYGRYEAFVCYVVKFNMKHTKNNLYEIELTMHSVQQFEVPTKHTGVTSVCPNPIGNCKVMDVQEYFDDAKAWKDNSFAKLMSLSVNDEQWKSHIVPIKNQNSTDTGAGSTSAGTRDNEYFVTWNFFVEKLLNDREYGLAGILAASGAPETLTNLAMLRVVSEPTASADYGLVSGQVGYHPALRSTNPGTMIIHNLTAQRAHENTSDRQFVQALIRKKNEEDKVTEEQSNILYKLIESTANPFINLFGEQTVAGASYLSRGVWLNTAAIKQAFLTTDTISSAINALLVKMNDATEGYWNLQLYSTDIKNPGMHVIDMALSKKLKIMEEAQQQQSTAIPGIDKEEQELTNPLTSVSTDIINEKRYQLDTTDKPKYIYMFNRKTKVFSDGELGSDIIDLNVEFNLPQVIAVQAIANIGGPAQKSLLQSIDLDELRKITLIDNMYTPCSTVGACSDIEGCQSDPSSDLSREAYLAQVDLENAAKRRLEAYRIGPGRGTYIVPPDIRTEADIPNRRSEFPSLDKADRDYLAAVKAYQSAQDNLLISRMTQDNPNAIGLVREYADLGTALQLIEINPSRMMKRMNLDSTVSSSDRRQPFVHSFNSSNLTKTVAEVTLPGIGGISLFQSFLIDRVPSILERGFYVVTKVTHDFTLQNGWITKIEGRFRFRPTKEDLAKEEPAIICP